MRLFHHEWYHLASRDETNLSGGFVFGFTADFPSFPQWSDAVGGFSLATAGWSRETGGRLAAAELAGWPA